MMRSCVLGSLYGIFGVAQECLQRVDQRTQLVQALRKA